MYSLLSNVTIFVFMQLYLAQVGEQALLVYLLFQINDLRGLIKGPVSRYVQIQLIWL